MGYCQYTHYPASHVGKLRYREFQALLVLLYTGDTQASPQQGMLSLMASAYFHACL